MNYTSYFKELYPHLSEIHIEMLEKRSKEFLVHLLYPSILKVSNEQKESAYEAYEMWILDCMECLIERTGMNSAISYSENGLSITFSEDMVSSTLKNLVVPITRFL